MGKSFQLLLLNARAALQRQPNQKLGPLSRVHRVELFALVAHQFLHRKVQQLSWRSLLDRASVAG